MNSKKKTKLKRHQDETCRRMCPGKVGHVEKSEAELRGRLLGKPYWRVYQCPSCRLWYVTTKPAKGEQ